MIDRYTPLDWYDDKRRTPKLYRDNETGEEISLHEFRKRKRAALAVDEGEEDEQEQDMETQAFAEPAPRPRVYAVPQAGEEQRSTVRRMGIAEMLAPAVAGFATSVALIRLRDRPTQVFVPPKEVTDPLLRPVGRIIDRHLPVDFALLVGEDGKDVAAFIVASGAAMTWFQDAMRAYEDYRQQAQQQYEQRDSRSPNGAVSGMDRQPAGAVPQSSFGAPGDWAGDILRRAGAGGGTQPNDGIRANGATTGAAIREPSHDEAVGRLRDLFSADSEGRMRRGLQS